jgi:hypothetical protein
MVVPWWMLALAGALAGFLLVVALVAVVIFWTMRDRRPSCSRRRPC